MLDAVEAYALALEGGDPYTTELAAILSRIDHEIEDVDTAFEIEEPDF